MCVRTPSLRRLRAKSTFGLAVAVAFGALIAGAGAVNAESMSSALVSAYMNNPTLRAERARQRQTDEQVSQALSGWRPTIIASGDAGHTDVEGSPSFADSETEPHGASVRLTQPIFRGFQTVNGTSEAEASIAAGQQTLLVVEQTVLLDAVTAYMDVMRDARIVQLREENAGILSEQLRGAEARLNVGDLNQTDVAQARARLSQSQSDLATARSNLASSRAAYVRVIGNTPAGLSVPPALTEMLPSSLDQAIQIAETRNPTLLASRYNEESSLFAVEVAIGELLPTLDFIAEYSHREDVSTTVNNTDTWSVSGSLSVPLYQSGSEHSRVREAKHLNSQRLLQIQEAMRSVREDVVVSWNQLIAARESIRSDKDQVEANEIAFRGIQQENLVGLRTILDVLDINEDLINSRILYEGSKRDEVVAGYRLLSAIGSLTALYLELPVPVYDPTVNLEQVRYQLFGIGVDEVE